MDGVYAAVVCRRRAGGDSGRNRRRRRFIPEITESIDVNVPVQVAYNQWTQFEESPKFMEGVKEVRQIDDTHLHWRAEIAGRGYEWDAEITEQRPDERVAWKSLAARQQIRRGGRPGLEKARPSRLITRQQRCSAVTNQLRRSTPRGEETVSE
jgi:hypothetical protein